MKVEMRIRITDSEGRTISLSAAEAKELLDFLKSHQTSLGRAAKTP